MAPTDSHISPRYVMKIRFKILRLPSITMMLPILWEDSSAFLLVRNRDDQKLSQGMQCLRGESIGQDYQDFDSLEMG